MEQAQLIIEEWLTECRDRTLYEAADINSRLNQLMEMITDEEAQHIMIAWREALPLSEYHGASRVSDNLLDMWGCVTRAIAQVAVDVEV